MKHANFLAVSLAAALLPGMVAAADDGGFLRDGDRWSIQGDSITANGGYVRALRLVVNHFHPGADIAINGIGVNGVPAGHTFAETGTPATVVSIMLGANNAFHRGYGKVDKPKALAAYRKAMLAKTRLHRAQGSAVLLLGTPLFDENYSRGWWELRRSNELIREFPRILREIATETGAFYLPVQEEMMAYRDHLRETHGIVRPLYPDGVHPNGWAQYAIAQVLWERLGVAGTLADRDQPRRLSIPFGPLPVRASLMDKFLEEDAPLKVRFQAEAELRADVNWSFGARRGRQTLAIDADGTEWTVPLNPEELAVAPGQNRTLVFDLAADAGRTLFLLDITGTRVWHLDQHQATGGDLPYDGTPKHGAWRLAKEAGGLMLSGTVADPELFEPEANPTSGSGLQIMLDLRQDGRFADLSFDEDVHLFCLNVADQPRFGVGIVPLWGRGIAHAGMGGARRTAAGYDWHFFVRYAFQDGDRRFDVEQSDFIGFNIDIVDRVRRADGTIAVDWIQYLKADYMPQNFPAFLHVVDLKNKLKGDHARVLNLWGSALAP